MKCRWWGVEGKAGLKLRGSRFSFFIKFYWISFKFLSTGLRWLSIKYLLKDIHCIWGTSGWRTSIKKFVSFVCLRALIVVWTFLSITCVSQFKIKRRTQFDPSPKLTHSMRLIKGKFNQVWESNRSVGGPQVRSIKFKQTAKILSQFCVTLLFPLMPDQTVHGNLIFNPWPQSTSNLRV